jgi:thioredoxin-like negative regulator of GroEL
MSESDLQEFKKFLQSTKKPVFVLVSAVWCEPCEKIKPVFENKSKDESKNASFIIVDADEATDICINYEISTVPTVLVFKNGHILDRFSGSTIEVLNKFIEKYLKA